MSVNVIMIFYVFHVISCSIVNYERKSKSTLLSAATGALQLIDSYFSPALSIVSDLI